MRKAISFSLAVLAGASDCGSDGSECGIDGSSLLTLNRRKDADIDPQDVRKYSCFSTPMPMGYNAEMNYATYYNQSSYYTPHGGAVDISLEKQGVNDHVRTFSKACVVACNMAVHFGCCYDQSDSMSSVTCLTKDKFLNSTCPLKGANKCQFTDHGQAVRLSAEDGESAECSSPSVECNGGTCQDNIDWCCGTGWGTAGCLWNGETPDSTSELLNIVTQYGNCPACSKVCSELDIPDTCPLPDDPGSTTPIPTGNATCSSPSVQCNGATCSSNIDHCCGVGWGSSGCLWNGFTPSSSKELLEVITKDDNCPACSEVCSDSDVPDTCPAGPDSDADFFVIGDWGMNPDDYSCPLCTMPDKFSCQRAIADGMLSKYRQNKSKIKFVLSLGDNFYGGIEDEPETAGKWTTVWRDIYQELATEVPWYSVMGNHDFGACDYSEFAWKCVTSGSGSPEGSPWTPQASMCTQTTPAKTDLKAPGWHMPNLNFHVAFDDLGLDVVALESNAEWTGEPFGRCDNQTDIDWLWARAAEGNSLLEQVMSTNTNPNKSLLVFNHYPNPGLSGPYGPTLANPTLQNKFNTIHHFGGHDHVNQPGGSVGKVEMWTIGNCGGYANDDGRPGYFLGKIKDGSVTGEIVLLGDTSQCR